MSIHVPVETFETALLLPFVETRYSRDIPGVIIVMPPFMDFFGDLKHVSEPQQVTFVPYTKKRSGDLVFGEYGEKSVVYLSTIRQLLRFHHSKFVEGVTYGFLVRDTYDKVRQLWYAHSAGGWCLQTKQLATAAPPNSVYVIRE